MIGYLWSVTVDGGEEEDRLSLAANATLGFFACRRRPGDVALALVSNDNALPNAPQDPLPIVPPPPTPKSMSSEIVGDMKSKNELELPVARIGLDEDDDAALGFDRILSTSTSTSSRY